MARAFARDCGAARAHDNRGTVHMVSVLGIDAAWTAQQPSGVALVAKDRTETWRCLCVAPSYAAFLNAAEGLAIQWNATQCAGDQPDVSRILGAAKRLLGGSRVDVVAIDMPVARKAITGRRAADNQISRKFGKAHCGTHSPNSVRPGSLGANVTAAFACSGYAVATAADNAGTLARLVEVYPHPALLRLLNAERRLKYKVSKARRYWPTFTVHDRICELLYVYAQILEALNREIDGICLPLPAAASRPSLSFLKRYEDALDAVVCAWVGCCYINEQAEAYGDHNAAIWIPKAPAILP